MPLSQLIYASSNHGQLSVSDIKQLVSDAEKENKACEISGFMCANRHFFLQCLEGKDSAIDTLFRSISADPRHSKVTLLSHQKIEQRSFPDWGMGVVTKLEKHKKLLRELNHTENFDPHQFDDNGHLTFLKALYDIQHGRDLS